MNLEQTIQYCFDRYPGLFQERWQVLDQLFCVTGNEYDWIDGGLVAYNEDRNYTPILDANGKAHSNNEAYSDIEFYPLSEYSAIFTIPDDIKPDWLEGVKEVVQLLLQYGFEYSGEKNEWQESEETLWTAELHKLAKKLAVTA